MTAAVEGVVVFAGNHVTGAGYTSTVSGKL